MKYKFKFYMGETNENKDRHFTLHVTADMYVTDALYCM